jgi:formyltetrahydrofolate deformylase
VLPADIVGVVSNHPDLRSLVEWYQIPFFHLPVTPETRHQQETAMLEIFARYRADLLVLARYMQVLSNDMCRALAGRCINIHHSFLPSFKGARPYHQAYQRGVKIIGATAHYVTEDLDEGPIIEQAVERVGHEHTPERFQEIGRDLEAIVLARAVRWHAERRILLDGQRSVILS